ncbi:hypothetical protein ETF27_07615 [Prevotella brunnea]|uniref:Uncharacterized protein n=1 Tax=Prevotella brunnea TaxID=2508867 RepID=A0A5C8GFV9_9BACT|nr:hypothetical protein [Prevotella brunnea]MDR0186462.1 hypothetical protein [Prevotella brunnea]TXJ60835.1 hypothetical protein ETF27_07615 [Prevotella brunnea]
MGNDRKKIKDFPPACDIGKFQWLIRGLWFSGNAIANGRITIGNGRKLYFFGGAIYLRTTTEPLA